MENQKKIEDPFGSDDEDMTLIQRDWLKVDDGMKNAGLRDAMESNQDNYLQEGFNVAFKDALQMAMAAGNLQGRISAVLSCPTLDKKSAGEGNTTVLPEIKHESKLQNLMGLNEDLISTIPSILQSNAVQTIASNLLNMQNGLSLAKCSSSDAVLKTTDENASSKQKNVFSCEDVCSSREHFWTQLESFKTQAESLGVIPSKE